MSNILADKLKLDRYRKYQSPIAQLGAETPEPEVSKESIHIRALKRIGLDPTAPCNPPSDKAGR